jgi:hypothetical protein
MVKPAIVDLGHPMSVAVDIPALTLDAQQPSLLIAIKASLLVLLLLLHWLQAQLLHRVKKFFFGYTGRRQSLGRRLDHNFFLFGTLTFPELKRNYLWQVEQRP